MNKSVLVAGADGFIGSHLAENLCAKGFNVKALVQYNSFGKYGWLQDSIYKNEMEIILGDIRDPQFCQTITKDVSVIYNLAALIAIPYSYVAPQSYVETNVLGTVNLCNAARDNSCKLIQVSTSEVYGSAQYVPMDESHPLQPQSPYSASKIASDSMALSFYNAFDLPVFLVRPFNTYGPRQSLRAVIPTVISQILKNEKKIFIGDITPTRDFNFVQDTCNAILEISKCDSLIGRPVNIGTGEDISIGDLISKIISLSGRKDIEIISDLERIRPTNSEVSRLCSDSRLLKTSTNFIHEISLDEGLSRTIEWFEQYLESNNIDVAKYHI